jgi:hypothetical protein
MELSTFHVSSNLLLGHFFFHQIFPSRKHKNIKTFNMFLFVARLLILSSMSQANIAPSSLTRRSLAAHSSIVLEKRAISTVEDVKEENKWLRENPGLLEKLSYRHQTSEEAYAVLESLKDRIDGRPFSEAAWNDTDNTLLETFNFKASPKFDKARNAAFVNLDIGIELIKFNNNMKWIDYFKNQITKRGIKVNALQVLKVERIGDTSSRNTQNPRGCESYVGGLASVRL